MQELTDLEFDKKVLSSTVPFVVDFWAEWCQPCKHLAKMLPILAEKYAGRVEFGKLNAEDNANTTLRYNISAVPTVIIFKNGIPVERFTGLVSDKSVSAAVDKLLA